MPVSGKEDFNPRSPRGGATLAVIFFAGAVGTISIHAPHEGERLGCFCSGCNRYLYFNPRSPRGGATQMLQDKYDATLFQSTLPTRGSDLIRRNAARHTALISIHAPHEGERRQPQKYHRRQIQFQSTLPTRGSDTVPLSASA